MPHALRHVHNVALIGEEDRQRTDLVFDLAFQDEPEIPTSCLTANVSSGSSMRTKRRSHLQLHKFQVVINWFEDLKQRMSAK
jgi:hypothetical protein